MISSEPRQTCRTCGRCVIVVQTNRGFPPEVAKTKLRKLCATAGHDSDPQYAAGVQLNPVDHPGRGHD